MAREIERKFLVVDDSYKAMATERRELRQGYLSRRVDATVRVRVADTSAFITVKGRNDGCVRSEWEYPIPVADAVEMLALSEGVVIEKTRWIVPYGGREWEVDEFHGRREGLVVAEVELDSADSEVVLPPFVGTEVTDDPRYYNSAIAGS